jgi:hypothetical protein
MLSNREVFMVDVDRVVGLKGKKRGSVQRKVKMRIYIQKEK